MLIDCRKQIQNLEKLFFEENDSDKEEADESVIKKQDEKGTGIKQFWFIPLSVNVREFDFMELAYTQEKNGGRLFDVITMDPPW